MKTLRRILLILVIAFLLAFIWMWWNRPQRTDMAGYAPASALVYLEANSLMDIADGIAATQSWKALHPSLKEMKTDWPSVRVRQLIAWTGVGPTPSVILARAQVAVVMLDLGAREQGDSITLKPEAALLIETHTSRSRIQNTVETTLTRFAESSYRHPTFKRTQSAGDEFLIWTAPENNRQIVAVIDGTLVVVANSERAVKACLEARRALRPTLRDDPELQRIREHLGSESSLSSGFVSAAHTGELLSLGVPVLFGRAPGGVQFDSFIAKSGPKIFGSAGWSAKIAGGAIEDRYFFSLKPPVVSRMSPLFQNAISNNRAFAFVPKSAYSLTSYNFKEPAETWGGLQTMLSSQLDTLAAILLSSVLKSALLPYGVEDPEKFLSLVGPDIMTAKLSPDAPGSILIASVRDEMSLRELLRSSTRSQDQDKSDTAPAIHFQGGFVLIGSSEDIGACSQAKAENANGNSWGAEHFGPGPVSTPIVTYAKDTQRVLSFISALARAQRTPPITGNTSLNQSIEGLPYAITETSLGEFGLERRTRSPFGQFSALVPLLFPE